MKTKSDEDRYYRITNLPQAIYLFAKGEQIAGINPTDSGKKEFAFVRTAELDDLVDIYKFGRPDNENLLVQVHVYETARNQLLDLLNGR
ncbi:MAG: DUF5659 domain-containing protein [Minisyncoccia bacterium]|jgi:hypothetical protein